MEHDADIRRVVLDLPYFDEQPAPLAKAARAGARRVVSEGLNAGQSIAGITIHNPFDERPARTTTRPRR